MKTLFIQFSILLFFGLGLSGCMVSEGLIIESEPIIIGDPPPRVHTKGKRIHHRKEVRIPPGHRPPRGKCRIWYRDVPPGKQPPPVSCHRISKHVPYGAVIIRG